MKPRLRKRKKSNRNILFGRGYNRSIKPYEKKEVSIILDDEQDLAVKTTAKRVLVVAGAGSGKTRVLTERIKHLLNSGVKPCNIVAITFTNMAAEEMIERLRDVKGIGDSFVGTLHSFANKIMKQSGKEFSIYDSEKDLDFHKELIEKYCSFLTLKRYLQYCDLLELAENGQVTEGAVQSFFAPSEQAELHYIERTSDTLLDEEEKKNYPETIKSLCKGRNVITFDELLEEATEYFKSLGAFPEYVMVDEFQDIGTLECNFLKSLNAENYYYVGDDYQAIYGFKGGNVGLFFSLINSENWEKHYLVNNYRNATDIIDLADYVIRQVGFKTEHTVNPLSTEKGTVNVMTRKQGKSYLANELSNLSSEERRSTFVLTRTNKELFELKNLFDYECIPYSIFKRENMTLSEMREVMNRPVIKLLTVHTSKGLEADTVHLWGNFPLEVPYYLHNDEERRVMYVGITRARKKLTIYN